MCWNGPTNLKGLANLNVSKIPFIFFNFHFSLKKRIQRKKKREKREYKIVTDLYEPIFWQVIPVWPHKSLWKSQFKSDVSFIELYQSIKIACSFGSKIKPISINWINKAHLNNEKVHDLENKKPRDIWNSRQHIRILSIIICKAQICKDF